MKPTILIIAVVATIVLSFLAGWYWTEIKSVSLIQEKQRCKNKWNGDFRLDYYNEFPDLKIQGWGNMKCTKTYTEGNKEITETLFDYDF